MHLMYRNTGATGISFECKLRARDLSWIYLSGGLAVIVTLGLAFPRLLTRLATYRASRLTVIAPDGLGHIAVAAEDEEGGEFGAEAVEALDAGFDFGL